MRAITCDPGLDRSGLSIMDGIAPPLYTGIIDTDKLQCMQDRLNHIRVAITSLIHEWHPEVMVIEEYYSFQLRSQGFHTGKVIGTLIDVANTFGIKVVMYSPSSLKALVPKPEKPKLTPVERKALKQLKAEGNAPKTKRWSPTKIQVRDTVNALLGTRFAFKADQCHISDSAGLGYLYHAGIQALDY